MIVRSDLRLNADELSRAEWKRLFQKLTFFDGDRNQVKPWQIVKGGVRLPRGAWSLLPDKVEYVDKRVCPDRRKLNFTRRLDAPGFSGQNDALDAIFEHEQGLVIAQPGFGKTQVALAFVAAVRTPTIVFVHTEDIMQQWAEYAKAAMPNAEVATWQGDTLTDEIGAADLTIAMVQTVVRNLDVWKKVEKRFGAVVVDEAHHAPAASWDVLLNTSSSRYRIGFTATQTRADGMHPLMRSLIGPVIFEQKFNSKVPVSVIPLKSGFKMRYRGPVDWPLLQNALVRDDKRNTLIADTAKRQVTRGHSTLVLTRRLEHVEILCDKIPGAYPLVGQGMTKKVRKEVIGDFREGKIMCLVATQLADEALDIPRLSRVILTYPGKHDGRIIQQIGRALREHPSKKTAIIYDIVDDRIGTLRRQWLSRKTTYSKLKIPIRKYKGEEVQHGTEATQRRLVAHRVRQRLAGSSRSNR